MAPLTLYHSTVCLYVESTDGKTFMFLEGEKKNQYGQKPRSMRCNNVKARNHRPAGREHL